MPNFIRCGVNTVTFERMWEKYDETPTWNPGINWDWMDLEVSESGRTAILMIEDPADRYWELFRLPEEELSLWSRRDRVSEWPDGTVEVYHVDYL